MSRKVHRVGYRLHPAGVGSLPDDELRAILRGADPLINRGGRTLLCRILKGSREKKVLELGLDRIPVHGYYRGIPDNEVLARIDWETVDYRKVREQIRRVLRRLRASPARVPTS